MGSERNPLSLPVRSAVAAGALALAMIVPADAGNQERVPSHCSGAERVIFSCTLQGGSKVASLCASSSMRASWRFLQYRFGTARKLEFQFPPHRSKSVEQFRSAHYFRAQVDRREVTFSHKGATYTVFEGFEGEEQPPQRMAGVSVQMHDPEDIRTHLCAGRYLSRLEELEGVVPCDPDAPLAAGSCPQEGSVHQVSPNRSRAR